MPVLDGVLTSRPSSVDLAASGLGHAGCLQWCSKCRNVVPKWWILWGYYARSMYDVRCTMYDVRCTKCDVRCTTSMYDVLRLWEFRGSYNIMDWHCFDLVSTVCSWPIQSGTTCNDVQCTMYNVRSAMYDGRCTMYNVRCTMCPETQRVQGAVQYHGLTSFRPSQYSL